MAFEIDVCFSWLPFLMVRLCSSLDRLVMLCWSKKLTFLLKQKKSAALKQKKLCCKSLLFMTFKKLSNWLRQFSCNSELKFLRRNFREKSSYGHIIPLARDGRIKPTSGHDYRVAKLRALQRMQNWLFSARFGSFCEERKK